MTYPPPINIPMPPPIPRGRQRHENQIIPLVFWFLLMLPLLCVGYLLLGYWGAFILAGLLFAPFYSDHSPSH